MGWKGNKWKVIVPLVIVAALAFAFWYGGGSGRHGWTASRETATPTPSAPSTPTATQAAAVTVTPESLPPVEKSTTPPTAAPSSEPTPTPRPTPTVTPTPTPQPTPTVTPTPTPRPTPTVTPTPTPTSTPGAEPSPAETPLEDTVTVSISCAVLLDRLDEAEESVAALVPAEGWLLPPTEAAFSEGESVFDLLRRVCRDHDLHMEFSNTPLYDSAYIEGIGNLYEFDFGEGSGWMYAVNGVFPNYGCSEYALTAGDVVEWKYTTDLGKDIGGGNLEQ